MITRRTFIATGLLGATALSVAGGWAWLRNLRVLGDGAGADEVLAAVSLAMLDGALPNGEPERTKALSGTVAGVRRAIAGLAPSSRGELSDLFALLSSTPGRRFLAGVPRPWREASAGELKAFLADWRTSGWSLKRSAYDALHQLVLAAWYGQPQAWAAIGYPGPPKLGA